MEVDSRLLRDIETARRMVAEADAEVTRVGRAVAPVVEAVARVNKDLAPAVEVARRIQRELSYYRSEPLPPLPAAVKVPAAAVPEKKRWRGWLWERARVLSWLFVVEVLKEILKAMLPA
jgi:hypothetical protein